MTVLEDEGVGTAAKISAVGYPCGFGDTEKCGYLYSGNIPIKYSDYEQVISIGICDYLSAVFLWENE